MVASPFLPHNPCILKCKTWKHVFFLSNNSLVPKLAQQKLNKESGNETSLNKMANKSDLNNFCQVNKIAVGIYHTTDTPDGFVSVLNCGDKRFISKKRHKSKKEAENDVALVALSELQHLYQTKSTHDHVLNSPIDLSNDDTPVELRSGQVSPVRLLQSGFNDHLRCRGVPHTAVPNFPVQTNFENPQHKIANKQLHSFAEEKGLGAPIYRVTDLGFSKYKAVVKVGNLEFQSFSEHGCSSFEDAKHEATVRALKELGILQMTPVGVLPQYIYRSTTPMMINPPPIGPQWVVYQQRPIYMPFATPPMLTAIPQSGMSTVQSPPVLHGTSSPLLFPQSSVDQTGLSTSSMPFHSHIPTEQLRESHNLECKKTNPLAQNFQKLSLDQKHIHQFPPDTKHNLQIMQYDHSENIQDKLTDLRLKPPSAFSQEGSMSVHTSSNQFPLVSQSKKQVKSVHRQTFTDPTDIYTRPPVDSSKKQVKSVHRQTFTDPTDIYTRPPVDSSKKLWSPLSLNKATKSSEQGKIIPRSQSKQPIDSKTSSTGQSSPTLKPVEPKYKQLLHDYAQRHKIPLPVYETEYPKDCVGYVGTVEICGKKYRSLADKNKKNAHSLAALEALKSLGLVLNDGMLAGPVVNVQSKSETHETNTSKF